MKKLLKPFSILGVIVLVIGIGLSIAAIKMGAEIVLPIQKGEILSTSSPYLEYFTEEELNQITEIDVEIKVASVIVTTGETFHLEYTNFTHADLLCEIEDNALIIKESDRFSYTDLFTSNEKPTILITIPYNYTLDLFYVKLGLGDLKINALSTKQFTLENGVGIVTAENLISENVVITGGVGQIDIAGEIKNLKYEGGVGEFSYYGVGSPDDYTYKIDAGIGDITLNGQHYTEIGNDIKIGNGKNNIDIDAGIGSITINIGDE